MIGLNNDYDIVVEKQYWDDSSVMGKMLRTLVSLEIELSADEYR